MRTQMRMAEPVSRTIQARKNQRQAGMSGVLQSDQKKVAQFTLDEEDDRLVQRKLTTQLLGIEDEEMLQGKFVSQLQRNEEDELLQGKAENRTGLPDHIKNGVESLSGYSLDAVKVYYNSPKPAQLQALAYTQGTDIHVGPGQERYLGHEAWHVVQQMQGRVQPTTQLQGVAVNDNEGLEREADVMGRKAITQMNSQVSNSYIVQQKEGNLVQLVPVPNVTMKRNNIKLLGDDKYGHWWTEIDTNNDEKPEESYGWWPKDEVGLIDTFKGVPGELNGTTSFGGTLTTDPHHDEPASGATFHPDKSDGDTRTIVQIIQSIKNVAAAWAGRNWQWVLGKGNNCHTFQEDILARTNLRKP